MVYLIWFLRSRYKYKAGGGKRLDEEGGQGVVTFALEGLCPTLTEQADMDDDD